MQSIVHIIKKRSTLLKVKPLSLPPNSHMKHCWVNVWLSSHWTIWRAPCRWAGKALAMCSPLHHKEQQCLVEARWTCVWTHGLYWEYCLTSRFFFFSSLQKTCLQCRTLLHSVTLWPPYQALLLNDLWSWWGLQIRAVMASQISSSA